jgi:putative transposase
MPLRIVPLIPDTYYHVYNRGSEKRIIFLQKAYYLNFLDRIRENKDKYEITLLSYCLMPNHFHFLIKQGVNGSIQEFMNSIQLGYAKYFNTKNERVGPLFQGRFKAKIVETDEYLLELSAYIHRNPHGIRHTLSSYPYSSYKEFVTKRENLVDIHPILSYFSDNNPNLSYQAFVENFKPDIEALSPWIHGAE